MRPLRARIVGELCGRPPPPDPGVKDEWVREKLETGELPPWEAKNERDRRWMTEWVIKEISEEEDRQAREAGEDSGFEAKYLAENAKHVEDRAFRLAERGDMSVLRDYARKLDPRLVPHINRPQGAERGQGKRFYQTASPADLVFCFDEQERFYPTTSPYDVMVYLACLYVFKIRDLWVEKCRQKQRSAVFDTPGTKNRMALEPTAEAIAADICGVKEADVRRKLHKFRRPWPAKRVPRG